MRLRAAPWGKHACTREAAWTASDRVCRVKSCASRSCAHVSGRVDGAWPRREAVDLERWAGARRAPPQRRRWTQLAGMHCLADRYPTGGPAATTRRGGRSRGANHPVLPRARARTRCVRLISASVTCSTSQATERRQRARLARTPLARSDRGMPRPAARPPRLEQWLGSSNTDSTEVAWGSAAATRCGRSGCCGRGVSGVGGAWTSHGRPSCSADGPTKLASGAGEAAEFDLPAG